MKSILVSRPLLFTLIMILSLGLVACERPLQDGGEELEAGSTPAFRFNDKDSESELETPAASEEIVLPVIEGGSEAPDDTGVSSTESVEVQLESVGDQPASHIVQAGDSLFTVAQRYNVSLDDLATINNMDANALLSPGTALIIPGEAAASAPADPGGATGDGQERIHVVQAGENLYRIGLVYGFTIEELAAFNSLEDPDYLDIGQEIRIPPDSAP